MKPWQWLAIPLAVALGTLVAVFPLTYYADPDQWAAASGNSEGKIESGWGYAFLPIWRVRALNEHELQLSSGGNATVNGLVVLLFMACVAAICGVIFGFRPRGFPERRRVMTEACSGFGSLALAATPWMMMAVSEYSWTLAVLTPILAVGGVVLLKSSLGHSSKAVS